MEKKRIRRLRRHRRIRARIRGTAARPRLSLFRSSRYISVQLIDDLKGVTLAQASERELRGSRRKAKGGEQLRAERVGTLIAERAKHHGISKAVFDRSGYRYHGRVRALAEGARKGGLAF